MTICSETKLGALSKTASLAAAVNELHARKQTYVLQAVECAWPTPQGFMCGNKLTAGTNSSVHSAPVSMRTG